MPQLLTLVGVPGSVKTGWSTSCKVVEADAELITWRQGRCLAYGDGITLWALGEIVKAQAGVLEQDTPEEIAAKVHQRVADTLAGTGDEARVERIFSRSSASPARRSWAATAGTRRSPPGGASSRALPSNARSCSSSRTSTGRRGPPRLPRRLVDWVTDAPLLVVATARPELLERRRTGAAAS